MAFPEPLMAQRDIVGARGNGDSRQPNGALDPRSLAIKTVVGMVVLGVVVALAGAFLEPHLVATAQWIGARLGVAGMMGVVFLADAVISPFPPDLLLVVISKGHHAGAWMWLVPSIGLASMLGGLTGALVLRRFGARFVGKRISRLLDDNRPILDRYGAWAVAFAAVTPIPFSAMCWLAGLARVRPSLIAAASALRIPRFVVYYLLIAHAAELGSWLAV